MRLAVGMLAGGLTGLLAAPLGAAVALGIAATSDISGLGLLLSLGGTLGALPGIAAGGLLLGLLIGALVSYLFSRG